MGVKEMGSITSTSERGSGLTAASILSMVVATASVVASV
jgi:hypothetical protein